MGFKLRAMVCNQGSPNQRAIKILGICEDHPFIVRKDQQFFFLYDVPHLIKCVRNRLIDNDIIINGDRVS